MNDRKSLILVGLTLGVLFAWGVVPGIAQLSDHSGTVITFYVNVIAVIALAIIITLKRSWRKVFSYRRRDYLIMGGIGLIWPLIYSEAYFEAIHIAGSPLTTIFNSTWPVFYMIAAWILVRKTFSRNSLFVILLSIAAIVITQVLKGGLVISWLPISLGLIAAVTQGIYSATDEKWSYDPLVMTFIIEVVTAIGSTVVVLVSGTDLTTSANQLLAFLIIGAFSNGLGFWAFLSTMKRSTEMGKVWKDRWLMALCLSPIIQVAFLPALGIDVSQYYWLGIGIVVVALFIHRFGDRTPQKTPQKTQ